MSDDSGPYILIFEGQETFAHVLKTLPLGYGLRRIGTAGLTFRIERVMVETHRATPTADERAAALVAQLKRDPT